MLGKRCRNGSTIERGENPGYNYEHFTVFDNLSIQDDRLRAVLRTYDKSSLWYQADLKGKRTTATGRIYTGYTYKDVVITRDDIKDKRFIEFSIGVDIGGTDATVATKISEDFGNINIGTTKEETVR